MQTIKGIKTATTAITRDNRATEGDITRSLIQEELHIPLYNLILNFFIKRKCAYATPVS